MNLYYHGIEAFSNSKSIPFSIHSELLVIVHLLFYCKITSLQPNCCISLVNLFSPKLHFLSLSPSPNTPFIFFSIFLSSLLFLVGHLFGPTLPLSPSLHFFHFSSSSLPFFITPRLSKLGI
ncbi:hypothetical protein I3843_Q060200 [Carya illinoinensis]|nr:hypothetical protein I3843_Q060200 [Carya illinoinensis]